MDFPEFFEHAPTITMHDSLTTFLGASPSGIITYCYADAVKLAGHSCPTVAGSWLMLRHGLKHLYRDETPERGGINVYLRDSRDSGATGVVASIATLVTGAAPETGFGGIGPEGRFHRRALMYFDAPIRGTLALQRRDTGKAVVVDLDTSVVPSAPQMGRLFPRVIPEGARAEDLAEFGRLWQQRVEAMLVAHANDPALVSVADWRAAA